MRGAACGPTGGTGVMKSKPGVGKAELAGRANSGLRLQLPHDGNHSVASSVLVCCSEASPTPSRCSMLSTTLQVLSLVPTSLYRPLGFGS